MLVPNKEVRLAHEMYITEDGSWDWEAMNKEEEPAIYLTDHTPKQYNKRYRVKTITTCDEYQLERNKDIIKEVLMKDLALLNGLKVNTSFNLILDVHGQGE